MFTFKNFTGISFVGKVSNFVIEFTAGMVEEITFNITTLAPANSAEIFTELNLKSIPKNPIIPITSLAISSKILESNIFGLIAGATPNLFI